jgi:O-antigen ligase
VDVVEAAQRGQNQLIKQSADLDSHALEIMERPSSRKLSFLRFLWRYPVFLLAFGPPIFRPNSGIDATKGIVDFWAFFQVGWIGLIALRAGYRMASAQTIQIPNQVRSILKLFLVLGILFLISAVYSPSHPVSAAYAILFLLTLICVVEFIVDSYRNPPDWMQCLFNLRMITFLLIILVFFTIPVAPTIVMGVGKGIGLRLGGGTVGPINVICPMMAVISWYAFLFKLEPRMRSAFFFVVGVAGTLMGESRGSELALMLCLVLLGIIWASTSKRSTYLFLAASFASILLAGFAAAVIGTNRIWNVFNKGQKIEGIESASGRTDIWKFIFHYCLDHPLGMGYVAGFRKIFREYFALGLQIDVTHIGNAHNAFMDILAAAGWPAFAIYLILLFKIIALGWRHARKNAVLSTRTERLSRHALRCALVLLVFCLGCGMDSAEFSVPLKTPFYLQFVVFALILGISARMAALSRVRLRSAA